MPDPSPPNADSLNSTS